MYETKSLYRNMYSHDYETKAHNTHDMESALTFIHRLIHKHRHYRLIQ